MKETEELYLLRFRYGRTAEMFIAYKTFLHRQVAIGDKSYCHDEEVVRQVTHTLLLTFYSFIYSLFDKSGTDFVRTTEPYLNVLTADGKKVRDELIEVWTKNEKAISKLRHNIGFHGGVKIKSHEVGYSALGEIHPQVVEFIMNHLALFFMEMDVIIPPREDYNFHVSPEMRKFIFDRAEKFKKQINDPAFPQMIESMKKLYSDQIPTDDNAIE